MGAGTPWLAIVHTVLKFICYRLLWMLPVLLGVSLISFMIISIVPGDPVMLMLGTSQASFERYEEIRRSLGLDDPIYVQYGRFLFNALHGDLGHAFRSNREVLPMVVERIPATFSLAVATIVIGIVVAIPLGLISALRHNRPIDRIILLGSLFGVSMPAFWFGILLIFLFSTRLGLLPPSGQAGPQYYILPAATLSIFAIARNTRLMRASLLEVLRADYVRTARAKGVGEFWVVCKHALRNAIIPVVTDIGNAFAHFLSGALVVEVVFSWPGIGRLMFDAVINREYWVLQGGVLLMGTIFVIINLLVDISYALIDPRIKYVES